MAMTILFCMVTTIVGFAGRSIKDFVSAITILYDIYVSCSMLYVECTQYYVTLANVLSCCAGVAKCMLCIVSHGCCLSFSLLRSAIFFVPSLL